MTTDQAFYGQVRDQHVRSLGYGLTANCTACETGGGGLDLVGP